MRPAGVNFYENEATGATAIENGMVSLKFRRQQSSASDNSLEKIKRREEKCRDDTDCIRPERYHWCWFWGKKLRMLSGKRSDRLLEWLKSSRVIIRLWHGDVVEKNGAMLIRCKSH